VLNALLTSFHLLRRNFLYIVKDLVKRQSILVTAFIEVILSHVYDLDLVQYDESFLVVGVYKVCDVWCEVCLLHGDEVC